MIPKEIDLSGKKLGNYEIVSQLGKGGMAVVYKAHEASLNRFVALKVLSSRLSEDAEYIKRFQREAKAAAQLNHPHIVQIYSIGEEEGIHYFAMEYIKGMALADLKRQEGVFSPQKAIPIIKQVAEALGEAHKVGLVHRDIKPSNIMLDAMGRAKVTDFGIAFVAGGQTRLTQEGSIIGTPEYLSPEQCEGRELDGRSDIYSLGVTLYELLTGKTPYEADTPVSMLMKIVRGSFIPISELKADVPQAVQAIVEKMMHTDRNQRYANVYQVIEALETVEYELYGVKKITANAASVKSTEAIPKTRVRTKAELEAEAVPVPAAAAPGTAGVAGVAGSAQAPKSGKWTALIVVAVLLVVIGGAFAAKIFYFDKQKKDTAAAADTVSGSDQQSAAQMAGLPPQSSPAFSESAANPAAPPAAGQEEQSSSDPAAGGIVVPMGNESGTSSTATGSGSSSSAEGSSTGVGTGSKPGSVSTQKPHTDGKPLPPANSVVLTTMGDSDKADMIAAYIQGVLNDNQFTVIDGPSVESANIQEIARYHLVTTAKQMGSTTLNYYGSSSELYTVGITMKMIDSRSGRIVAGPLTATVKYTAINAEENLQEAVEKLTLQLKNKL